MKSSPYGGETSVVTGCLPVVEEVTVIRLNGMPFGFQEPPTAKRIALGVGLVLALVGSLFVALAVGDYREGEETKGRPAITGQILSAEVNEDVRRDRNSDGGTRTRRTYTSAITYEYLVDGTTFQGHRIKADDASGSQSRAYEIINRYPVGSDATVYYDPDDPGSAVLEQGADMTRVYLFGGVGGVFALVGLAALAVTGLVGRRT